MLHKQEKKAGFYSPFIISNIVFQQFIFGVFYFI